MLRPANDHETAAFYLVERTMQRRKPRVGPLGLKAVEVEDGTIERSLGRLRFRFDGRSEDFEPENRSTNRAPSTQEILMWNGLQRLMSATKPVADSEWNLVSMRIGPRVLSRLPLGSIVTYVPNGTPPFKGTLDPVVPVAKPEPELRRSETFLLEAIDAFLREPDVMVAVEVSPWKPQTVTGRQAVHIFSVGPGHGRSHKRGKWERCPLCHTPVVKGLFNPRIPYGQLRPGTGSIRDLRGGYLTRLRETYLVSDPNSLIRNNDSVFGPQSPGSSSRFQD